MAGVMGVDVVRLRGRKLQELRVWWFTRYPLCVICEQRRIVRAAVELDHIVPLWKGGTNDQSNLQGLCKACHDEKSERECGERVGRPLIGVDGWPVLIDEHGTSVNIIHEKDDTCGC